MKNVKCFVQILVSFSMILSFSCRFDENPFPEVPFPQDETLNEYDGKIYNVFFHPLLIYPELAFDNDKYHNLLYDWFVTYNEARSMIEDLYSNGFILVTVEDLVEQVYDEENRETVFVRKRLFLPKNKKPLLLSIDDLNFYKITVRNGTAAKLIIDADGRLSEVVYNGNKEVIMRGRSIVTLVDEFVKNHPDFSFGGKKGLIALTGYEGAFGYRTNIDKSEMGNATRVADYLKMEGWELGSHTYSHINIRKTDVSAVEKDDLKWKHEVGEVSGETRHLVYPYGSFPFENSSQFKYYLKNGYTFFWSVGNDNEFRVEKKYVIMNRMGADGKCVTGLYGNVSEFFDIKKAADTLRPKFSSVTNIAVTEEKNQDFEHKSEIN